MEWTADIHKTVWNKNRKDDGMETSRIQRELLYIYMARCDGMKTVYRMESDHTYHGGHLYSQGINM